MLDKWNSNSCPLDLEGSLRSSTLLEEMFHWLLITRVIGMGETDSPHTSPYASSGEYCLRACQARSFVHLKSVGVTN